ncbi:uncharacterized protein PG998_000614 [Apiospora kogelbergensis]|uniref:uncharacterized protein n=1 Tax=Apiospora kogelbergensis TaxID=1337665 RepID=UPI00312D4358
MDYAAPANKDNRRNKNQTAGGVWGAVVEPLVREDTEHNRAFAKRLEQRRRAREEPDASQRRGKNEKEQEGDYDVTMENPQQNAEMGGLTAYLELKEDGQMDVDE